MQLSIGIVEGVYNILRSNIFTLRSKEMRELNIHACKYNI